MLIGLLLFLGSGWGTLFSGDAVGIVVVGALNGLGTIAFRYANLETTNLGVNALNYLRPVLSLV